MMNDNIDTECEFLAQDDYMINLVNEAQAH
jgi:hypothetical protein